jgi:hypothetical protein
MLAVGVCGGGDAVAAVAAAVAFAASRPSRVRSGRYFGSGGFGALGLAAAVAAARAASRPSRVKSGRNFARPPEGGCIVAAGKDILDWISGARATQ